MKQFKLLVVAYVLVASLWTLPAIAQSVVGTVYGSVEDATGARLSGVELVLTNVHTTVQQTIKANGHGDFLFNAVQPSDYTVRASMKGFRAETQTNVTVDANQNVNVSFQLIAGSVSDSVEVTAGTTMVDTREAQIGETVDSQRIEELPTINRDPYELLQTVTGVSGYSEDTVTGSRYGANFSTNGFPLYTSSFYLDGAFNTALKAGGGNKSPNPSALQEARVLTSNFDAEFGRSPGGVVNLITKSGTSQYHGQLYEYLRNNAFDAKPYFFPHGSPVNFHQHQYGATIGGPIRHLPQAFFFTSFERLQLHQNAYITPSQVILPTAAEAAGDFRADAASFKTATFSCNNVAYVLCPADMDKVGASVMKLIPSDDPVTGVEPLQSSRADVLVNQGLGRIDFQMHRHAFEGTYFESRGSDINPTAGGNTVLSYAGMYEDNDQKNIILGDVWIVSNNIVNSARAFYTGDRYIIRNEYSGRTLSAFGAEIPVGGPIAAPPQFTMGNGVLTVGSSGAGPSDVNQMSFGLIDVATITEGRHSIKLGGSYVWDKYSEDGASSAGGNFNMGLTISGNIYYDLLSGRASTFTQSTSLHLRKHNYDPALFMQDNWHLFSRMTLNLGLRWEVYPPYYGNRNSGTFRAGVQSTVFPTAPLGILYEGDKNVPVGIANTSYSRFAPRLGFAWDVYGNGQTSLRGGYGIFYYQQIEDDQGLRTQQPYGLTEAINSPPNFVNPYAAALGVSPFPYSPDVKNPTFISQGVVYAQPSNGGSTPYAQEYNLSMEQQLNKTYALHVAYVGSNYIKQTIGIDINTPVYGTGAVIARRPYEPYGQNSAFKFAAINEYKNIENTHFSSLQATLRGRLGRDINLNVSYVWAKALNYLDPVDQTNIKSGFGPGNQDLRNRFVLSGIFSLPSTKRYGFMGRQVISHWRLSTIFILQSGTPYTIMSGVDTNADGNGNDHVNIIRNPYVHPSTRAQRIRQWIDPSALAVPTGLYGNEQRNQFTTPGSTTTNVTLSKEFPLPEHTRFQFRADAFNVMGNVNLNSPRTSLAVIGLAANVANPAFQQLQNAAAPRRLQFAAKFLF